jgi:uncharacterized SAM-binding protein YcdF (DUF218 family)
MGRAAAFVAVLAAASWVGTSSGPTSHALVRTLEDIFPPAQLDDGTAHDYVGVVVLGGEPGRIREAGRLARTFKHLRVIITGAGDPADILALLGPGIEPGRVQIEPKARNTHENALFTAQTVRPAPGERWLLVTSAFHMPRAMGAFRRSGFNVEPWPLYDLDHVNPRPMAVAQHEWLGLAAYWILGRSRELLPRPSPASVRHRSVRLPRGMHSG